VAVEIWRCVQVEPDVAPVVDKVWWEAERMALPVAEDAAADPGVGNEGEVAKCVDERPLPADALVKSLAGEGGSRAFDGGRPCRREVHRCIGKAGNVVGEHAGSVECPSLASGARQGD